MGCKGEFRECFYYDDKINLGGEDVSKRTVNTAVEIRREKTYKGFTDLAILLEIGICPTPLITSTSQALYKTVMLMGSNPLSYNELNEIPAYLVEARNIVFEAQNEALNLWVPVVKT